MRIVLYFLLLFCTGVVWAADETENITTTTAAPTSEEACARAQSIASEGGQVPGECTCEIRDSMSICRVQSTVPKQAESLMSKAKKELRERTKCQPEDKECLRKSNRSAGDLRG